MIKEIDIVEIIKSAHTGNFPVSSLDITWNKKTIKSSNPDGSSSTEIQVLVPNISIEYDTDQQ